MIPIPPSSTLFPYTTLFRSVSFLERKFAKRPEIAEANKRAFHAGYAFGETTEDFAVSYQVKPAKLRPGTYRNITRSEERRVGKECRSRWSTDHEEQSRG